MKFLFNLIVLCIFAFVANTSRADIVTDTQAVLTRAQNAINAAGNYYDCYIGGTNGSQATALADYNYLYSLDVMIHSGQLFPGLPANVLTAFEAKMQKCYQYYQNGLSYVGIGQRDISYANQALASANNFFNAKNYSSATTWGNDAYSYASQAYNTVTFLGDYVSAYNSFLQAIQAYNDALAILPPLN